MSGGVDGSINVGIFLPTVSLEIFRGVNIRRFSLSTRIKPYTDANQRIRYANVGNKYCEIGNVNYNSSTRNERHNMNFRQYFLQR